VRNQDEASTHSVIDALLSSGFRFQTAIEIHALVTVIPLLIDNETASSDVMHLLRLDSARLAGKPSSDDMPALETSYPWVRQTREEDRRWHQEPCPEHGQGRGTRDRQARGV
jgi:hypothetical protein